MKPVIILAALAVTGCGSFQIPTGTTHAELETTLCGSAVKLRYASGQDRKSATLRADCQAGTFELVTSETEGLEAQIKALETAKAAAQTVTEIVRTISPAGARWQLHSTPAPALPVPFEGIGE